MIQIKYLNCHTLKLVSKMNLKTPKSVNDAEVEFVENKMQQTTL